MATNKHHFQDLRVVHIIESAGAGVGRHVLDVIADQKAAGLSVSLIYSPLRMDQMFATDLPALQPLKCFSVNIERAIGPSDISSIIKVRRILRKEKFDIVHGHSSKGGAIARVAAIGLGVPVVYTPHCLASMAQSMGRMARRFYGCVEIGLSLLTDRIIATSTEEAEHLVSLGIAKRKVALIRNAIRMPNVPVDRSRSRSSLAIKDDEIVIGFVGRLVEQKNPNILFRTFGKIAKVFPKAILAIVGEGHLEPALRNLANDLGIQGRVRWLGFQNGSEVIPSFDVLAIPSTYETGPIVMMEAMSVGVPVVVTRVGCASETIEDRINGCLVDVGSEIQLEHALTALLESKEFRESIGRRGMESASQFSAKEMVQRILDLYAQLLARD